MPREVVLSAFEPFSVKFEGAVPYMYADVKGLVSTGIGNLIDNSRLVSDSPPAKADSNYSAAGGSIMSDTLDLPWKNADQSPASHDQILSAWSLAKDHTATPGRPGGSSNSITGSDAARAAGDMSQMGGGNWKSLMANTVHLDADGLAQLFKGKLMSNEKILIQRFPAFTTFPADAQLALHSMSWALGPSFRFPKFMALINAVRPNFKDAAPESFIPDASNPGLHPRNLVNNQLFLNADAVLSQGLDPDKLYMPLPNPGEGRDAWVKRVLNTGIQGGGSSSSGGGGSSSMEEATPSEMAKKSGGAGAIRSGMSGMAKAGIVIGSILAAVAGYQYSKR